MEEKAGYKALSDDILEAVNGGSGHDDAQANRRCPHCSLLLKKNGKYYRCAECNHVFDEYGNERGGDD